MPLPIDFITRAKALLADEYPKLEQALAAEVPVSIRMNRRKSALVPMAEAVPWCETGYYLPERLSFTFDPLFHAGVYYVQEASSMFLEQAIRNYVHTPVTCLDLCAAPGGKSTHLLSLLPEGSLLVSNEVIRSRSNILAENIAKWGYPNTIVTNNAPEEVGKLTHLFDVIVTDVPCSGEGMFRKDTDSTGEWSVANVQLCASRQRTILHDIWNALAPDGILIYSTCTYNTEEDEENIHHIANELGAEVLSIPTAETWDIAGSLKYDYPVYRFFPHRVRGEGFFIAVLKKTAREPFKTAPEPFKTAREPFQTARERISLHSRMKNKKDKSKQQSAKLPAHLSEWLTEPDSFSIELKGDSIVAIPLLHAEIYDRIAEKLRIVGAGITLGELKGKDVVPAQPLALSLSLNQTAFPHYTVSWDEAIRYLKKEALLLPESIEKGYVLLVYKGTPLGFVKHLGNRANNLYPQEWRIRSGYLPNEAKLLE